MFITSDDSDLVIRTFRPDDVVIQAISTGLTIRLLCASVTKDSDLTRQTCERYLEGFQNTTNQFLAILNDQDVLVGTMTLYFKTCTGPST